MQLLGRNFVKSGAKENRRGFNGMEDKGEENSYDFGARMLDPCLGCWLTIASKASGTSLENFPRLTKYEKGKTPLEVGKVS